MYTFTLPSGPEIELREMTGAEEELLTNQRLIRSGDAINQALHNCTIRIGENDAPTAKDMLDMLSGDRLFALVRLRQVSLGDEVELSMSCANPSCRETNAVTIDLNTLEVTPYGEQREFAFQLPTSGQTLRFAHLDGHKEKRLAALKEPTISAAMMIRIIDIDGQPPSKKALAEMALRDRNALRMEMARGGGGRAPALPPGGVGGGGRLRPRREADRYEADTLLTRSRHTSLPARTIE